MEVKVDVDSPSAKWLKWDLFSDERLMSQNIDKAQAVWDTITSNPYNIPDPLTTPYSGIEPKQRIRLAILALRQFAFSFGLRDSNMFPESEFLRMANMITHKYSESSPKDLNSWLLTAMDNQLGRKISFNLSVSDVFEKINLGCEEYAGILERHRQSKLLEESQLISQKSEDQ